MHIFAKMYTIRKATINDIESIRALAIETWHQTYRNIISAEQIEFMLGKFYAVSVISKQIEDPQHYMVVAAHNQEIHAYYHAFPQATALYISKLYVLPAIQQKKLGSLLLAHAVTTALSNHLSRLTLNVNRHNPAVGFYTKFGFKIIETIDIPLDKFWLNDYVMEKQLSKDNLNNNIH